MREAIFFANLLLLLEVGHLQQTSNFVAERPGVSLVCGSAPKALPVARESRVGPLGPSEVRWALVALLGTRARFTTCLLITSDGCAYNG
jgi:hypothetical protein